MRAALKLENVSDASTAPAPPCSRVQRASIDAVRWLAPEAEFLDFDHLIHTAEDATERTQESLELVVCGSEPALSRAASEVATRYQRLWPRYNQHSAGGLFERVLEAHRTLHDRTKPLVRADYDHALDVWQWVLRLAPDASAALQVAALFHDIERLVSEPDVRIEQHARDYQAFKNAHAARGAELLRDSLSDICPEALLVRASALVCRHEQPSDDAELCLLNDADALSFFSLNSPGFLAYYGPAHTEKKVRYTARRISSRAAQCALEGLRLQPFVAAALAGERTRQHAETEPS
ncbi:MAG: hypothetical protein JWN48_5788 [Myxococcaceae bacterium]|nr:hypothetical protein [Myxococcaceae bacterium]